MLALVNSLNSLAREYSIIILSCQLMILFIILFSQFLSSRFILFLNPIFGRMLINYLNFLFLTLLSILCLQIISHHIQKLFLFYSVFSNFILKILCFYFQVLCNVDSFWDFPMFLCHLINFIICPKSCELLFKILVMLVRFDHFFN